jgi:hypothetical protein
MPLNGATAATFAPSVEFLAEHWPPTHERNKAYLALEGGLLNDGLTTDQAKEIVSALVEAVGGEDALERAKEVNRTAKRQEARQPTTGWPRLAECLGEEGESIVGQFRRLLGTASSVEQLARHKKLPEDFLRGLGLRDLEMGGVEIPYRDRTGKEGLAKLRRGLSAKTSLWPKGKALMCYGEDRLEDAVKSGYALLVEGESNCWAGWFHGLPVLGIPGANVVEKALAFGLVASIPRLTVVQDPDSGGEDFLRNLRSTLSRLGWTGELRVVRLPVKDLSDLHCVDPDGFLTRWQEAVVSAVQMTVGGIDAVSTPQGDPIPPAEPPWPSPPDEAAYHGWAGDFVRLIGPNSEADPVALLFQAIVCFGNAIGRTAHFRVEGDTHYLNENGVLVGDTSKARKGSSWGHVRRMFAGAEEEWEQERIKSGLSSGEGLIWSVRDPIFTRQPVKEKGRVTDYEVVESDPGVPDKRLLAYESEFASVLKQTERKGNTLSVLIRQAWESGSLCSLTKNTPAKATGAHVSIIGHITSEELRRYLTNTESANGFGNRFWWLCVRRSKSLPFPGRAAEDEWAVLQTRLREALQFAAGVGEMTVDPQARDDWIAYYPELSDARPGLAGHLLSRAEAHVFRVACIYALLDHSALVRPEHLDAAMALWDFSEDSVRHVFGFATGNPVADEMLLALRNAKEGLTRTDIRDLFGRNKPADAIGQALGVLLKTRLAHCWRQRGGGRPAERWYFGPDRSGRNDYDKNDINDQSPCPASG